MTQEEQKEQLSGVIKEIDALITEIGYIGLPEISDDHAGQEALKILKHRIQHPHKDHPDMDNGWIKVFNETMPPENTSVFVFIPEEDDHVTVGMWDVSKKWVLLDEYRVPISEVTHWRPIDFELPQDRTFKSTEGLTDEENSHVDKTIHKLRKEVFDLQSQLLAKEELLKAADEIIQMLPEVGTYPEGFFRAIETYKQLKK